MEERGREMARIRVTVLKKFNPKDVFGHDYVNPRGEIVPACYVFDEGEEFLIDNLKKPEKFCGWGWKTVVKDLEILNCGDDLTWTETGVIYSSCTDGVRPVVFKLERVESK
ncbi:MAG: TIGR04076 family protein [Candidatus Sifarchaeia archaeon]